MTRRLCLAIVALAVLQTGPTAAQTPLFKNSTTGSPKVQLIDTIRFGPNGLLLIGDGRAAQILAVETGDTQEKPALTNAIDNIKDKLAARLGTMSKDLDIVDLAVNPASRTAYLAVRTQGGKKPVILTVDGSGKIDEFVLEKVKYARLSLPAGEKAPISKITDVAWAGSRVLAAAQANEEFACKIFSIPVPLDHDAQAAIYSTETYHVSHGKWETRAPMSTIMPFEENGKMFLVGSFACTPVVKYPLDDLKPGAKVKGISVVELGSGNRPLNMFTYEKNGTPYILMNTHRFHHEKRPFGPSPYWTVRMDRGLLGENEKVDTKAVRRLDGSSKPATERMKMAEEYHGVVHMDRLDKDRALVIRTDDKGGFTLTPLPLP